MRAYMPHYYSHVAHIYSHIWPIYARMHAPLLLPCGPYMPLYMAMYTRMYAPLLLPYGPYMPLYMTIYARMYPPLSGTKIRTIRKAVKKRQALYLIWTSLLALAIYKVAYRGKNGSYMPPYMAYVCAHACPIAAPIWPMYAPIYGPCMSPLLLQNMAHSCLHIAYCSAHAWAITALVQIRYKAWRFNRFANCPNLCTTQWSIYARIYRPYMGAAMGHARIYGPYGSSNGACIRAYMGHIWGHIWAT